MYKLANLTGISSARRELLRYGVGALLSTALGSTKVASAQTATLTDIDFWNFALNVEYLQAQFYSLAALGVTIDVATGPTVPTNSGTGGAGGTVTVRPGPKVPFADAHLAAYATQFAKEQRRHIVFLRNNLAAATVAMPNLDLLNSFNTVASAAGIGASLDPFANDQNFLLGAFFLEDLSVTMYQMLGAKMTLAYDSSQTWGLLTAEAYHAGAIRTLINNMDIANPALGIASQATALSAARSKLDGTSTSTPDDVGLTTKMVALNSASASYKAYTVAPGDGSSEAFSRSTAQLLSILYTGGSGKGGFFPSGLNGTIK